MKLFIFKLKWDKSWKKKEQNWHVFIFLIYENKFCKLIFIKLTYFLFFSIDDYDHSV